jgi:hypothetical protein
MDGWIDRQCTNAHNRIDVPGDVRVLAEACCRVPIITEWQCQRLNRNNVNTKRHFKRCVGEGNTTDWWFISQPIRLLRGVGYCILKSDFSVSVSAYRRRMNVSFHSSISLALKFLLETAPPSCNVACLCVPLYWINWPVLLTLSLLLILYFQNNEIIRHPSIRSSVLPSIHPSIHPSMILQSSVGLWPLFQFLNPIKSR